MKLNQFIWDNYKESTAGNEAISFFEKGSFVDVMARYIDEKNKSLEFYGDIIHDFIDSECQSMQNLSCRKVFDYFISKGLTGKDEEGEFIIIDKGDFNLFLDIIEPFSFFLYDLFPDYFFPYFFQSQFQRLQKICDVFEIDLPVVPLRKQKKDRLYYYLNLCDAFQEFRQENNLTPFELCAFLYDFAPKFIEIQHPQHLPAPSNIWLCGGAKSDYTDLIEADKETTYFWQGNEDTRKGDIIIMYCLSPRSSIEFVCRATSNGIRDPFFHYYGSITLGQIKHIKPIHISELKTDKHLGKLPIIRKNLQGVNGTQINNKDYHRILELLEEKRQDISSLPKMERINFEFNTSCRNEKNVEEKIVEPFLRQLGFNTEDWVRQLSVRMGRGERNYPDYVFLPITEKGYEKGRMILETKFNIKNNKEWEDTFQQAHSYALRLEASKIIICDKDYFWIYIKENGSFDRTKYLNFHWEEIKDIDIFNKIRQLIGKEFL